MKQFFSLNLIECDYVTNVIIHTHIDVCMYSSMMMLFYEMGEIIDNDVIF